MILVNIIIKSKSMALNIRYTNDILAAPLAFKGSVFENFKERQKIV